jgi:hypothetical protein
MNKAIVYSVWVGGSEINDYYIYDLDEAERVADHWKGRGHSDVIIEKSELDLEK